MTRKDYVKVAEIVSAAKVRYAAHGHWHAVHFFETELADLFAADSSRFDREQFKKACEVKEVGK